ncbi:MAG TPA: ABC transporter permease [Gemmatimonadales bacterium]
MSWIAQGVRGVRRAFRLERWMGEQVERELDDEFRFHLEMREGELRDAGWSPEAARAEARRRFGDTDEARRYCRALDHRGAREGRRREWARGWGQDLRSAVRQLRRAPTLALVAVLTLSLGIGATTAIFSVVHRLMLAPLPYPDADRIVAVSQTSAQNDVYIAASPELVDAWREGSSAFEHLGIYTEAQVVRTGSDDGRESLRAARLSAEVPAVLGIRPQLGRLFLAEEARPGAAPVAMLAYGYWQRAFGGRDDVIGEPVTLDGRVHTIVGVLPRDFVLPSFSPVRDRQVVLPLVPDSTIGYGFAIGRLREGVTTAVASAQLSAVMRSLAAQDPQFEHLSARVMRQEEFLGRGTRQMLLVFMGAVTVVLLIACANVAGLLLARAAARQRELAVRAALGAGRRRLVRQLLTESALLGVLGGVGGVGVAWLGLRAVMAMRPPSLDELEGMTLDPQVLLGAIALALVTSLVFGLAPAMLGAAEGLRASLVVGSRSATGHRRSQRLRAALVGGEVALSVVLLVCAGLLVRSVLAMHAVDVGFDPRNLYGAGITLPEVRYSTPESRPAVYAAIRERLETIPGVVAASVGGEVPPDNGVTFGKLEIDGMPDLPADAPSTIGYDQVSVDYFRVIGTPLLAGQLPSDTAGSPIVINETFARRFWPDGRAIGERLRLSENGAWRTVVGIVGDVRRPGSRSSANELRMHVPFDGTSPYGAILVRTSGDAPQLRASVERAVAGVDPDIELHELRTAEGVIATSIAGPRFSMTLLGVFAVVALVLATVGLYGVVSLAVTQRTREIGVRMALGASPRGVTAMVVRQAMLLAGGGLVAGLAASVGAVRAVRGMLYGVEPLDAPTFVVAAASLAVVAFVAALVPARRAARVDAMVALRAE